MKWTTKEIRIGGGCGGSSRVAKSALNAAVFPASAV